jgi:hypothetical protein
MIALESNNTPCDGSATAFQPARICHRLFETLAICLAHVAVGLAEDFGPLFFAASD